MNQPHLWWYITRASAIIGWVLLTISVLWGILLSTRVLRKVDNPAWLQDLHRFLSGTALVMVGLHMVSLMLDEYVHFSFAEVLIPGATSFKTISVAFGIVAFYVMFAVQATSWFMNVLPRRVWKAIHYLAYLAVLLVAVHAGFTGTDVKALWYKVLAVTLIGLTTLALVVRVIVGERMKKLKPSASARKPARVETGEILAQRGSTTADITAARSVVATRDFTVTALEKVATGTVALRLEPADSGLTDVWYPGAHITLHLANGMQRQYSLCGDPADRTGYMIAVLRTQGPLGGSSWIHENVTVGTTLPVSGPLNHFALEPAQKYLFIAGGIGITPIRSMIESLPAQREWQLIYLGRSKKTMAFLAELKKQYGKRIVALPADEQDVPIDIRSYLSDDTVVYCCGPESLMSEVAAAVPAERMHMERFIAVQRDIGLEREEIVIDCKRSKERFTVGTDETILDVLEEQGIPITGSCRKGVCGTCEVRVLAGTPLHLDSVVEDAEKDALGIMFPCVSRAKSESLTLDI